MLKKFEISYSDRNYDEIAAVTHRCHSMIEALQFALEFLPTIQDNMHITEVNVEEVAGQ